MLLISFLSVIYFLTALVQVHSSIVTELNTGWTITNRNNSIRLQDQSIPSGVYSALEEANITESVLFSYNDVNLRWIAHDQWNYTLTFNTPSNVAQYKNAILVFHGIDTIARIFLNGFELPGPSPQNMFVRYRYNIRTGLSTDTNVLNIKFEPTPLAAKELAEVNTFTPPECPPPSYKGECHMNFLRKMQASFSWDWGLAAPSVGLWKPVAIEFYDTAIIRDIVFKYKSGYEWLVNVTTYLEAGTDVTPWTRLNGTLLIEIDGITQLPYLVVVDQEIPRNGEIGISYTFKVWPENIKLWWPNGYGDQNLYNLKVTWVGNGESNEKTVKVGFRTVEVDEGVRGDGTLFQFKVNGENLFMKGTNWIPTHILPEKMYDTKKIDHLFKAVKDTNMNMMRVWGGGIYELDYFYQKADELGIFIWQDMMYACAMYPVFNEFLGSVRMEIRQNVQRLQHHPSIALWAGNNENEAALRQNWYGTYAEFDRFAYEYALLYQSTIREEVVSVDDMNTWIYSSPSNGVERAKIELIQQDPQDWRFGDIHHYDYVSDGWEWKVYPRPRFASEYGFQSIPSYSNWLKTKRDSDDLSDLIDHRQHHPLGSEPIINLIQKNLPEIMETNDQYLRTLIYFSQISQAMTVRAETEVYRAERGGLMSTMGALYWQLNDVWIAPSWSSVEFNGNYKILHYWLKDVFAPLTVIAQIDVLDNVRLSVVRDTLGVPDHYFVTLRVFNWDDSNTKFQRLWNVTMEPNSVRTIDIFWIGTYLTNIQSSFMEFVLQNQFGDILSSTHVFPEKFKNIHLINRDIWSTIESNDCQYGTRKIQFDVHTDVPHLFVYIEINNLNIDQYSLSNNGYVQVKQRETIYLEYEDPNCSKNITEDDLIIRSLNRYLSDQEPDPIQRISTNEV